MRLNILTYPDPELLQASKPVEEITPELKTLVEDMVETMYEDDGVGLAAPQIGRKIRLITVDQTGPRERKDLLVLFNPEIVEAEGKVDSTESCLSTPGFTTTIKRSASVVVTAMDEKGKDVRIEANELLAIILQHEIDHLNGITIVNRSGRLKRAMYEKKVKKWARKNQ